MSSQSSLNKILKGNKSNSDELDSIKLNIENILNTRNNLSVEEYIKKSSSLSVIDFGIPELLNKPIPGADLEKKLCEIVEVAISSFEPRITNVIVEIEKSEKRKLFFRILASVKNKSINLNLVLNNLLWKID